MGSLGLIGAVGGAFAGAADAAKDYAKFQDTQELERQRAKLDTQRLMAIKEYEVNLAAQQRSARAAEIRGVLTPPSSQPNAQLAVDAGLNDAANVGEDENVGVDVQMRPRPFNMQEMALAAARGGYVDTAKDLAAADYYSGRNTLAAGRLAQGERRLDLTADLNDAKIDNLDARSDLAAARMDSVGTGQKLTSAQLVRNAEIDAARKKIDGIDPAAIRVKTSKFSATGRENPDYDPSLSRAAGLAGRRKVGDDPWFDQMNGGGDTQPAAKPRADVADLANRFASDPAMKSMRMGRLTPQGREVIDASGKLVGYYH